MAAKQNNRPTSMEDAWNKVRSAGGSILDPDGANLTADAGGAGAFQDYMKSQCSISLDKRDAFYDLVKQALDQAAWMAEANQNPLVKPKCHSKPMIQLQPGCEASFHMAARNKNEEDCGG